VGMTLQDVFDAVKAIPKRFGFARWFENRKPYCPLAVLVLADLPEFHADPEGINGLQGMAAERLDCPVDDVQNFVTWWDGLRYPNLSDTEYRRETLVRLGYNVPTEKELRDAGM